MSVVQLVQLAERDLRDKRGMLGTPSEEVVDFGDAFQQVVDDLIETFMAHRIAIGLAAPQIGISKKFAVINISKDRKEPHIIIVNPVVASTSGKKDKKNESCMSLPGYAGEVERKEKMNVSYQDRHGKQQHRKVEGFLARVFAHEIDHLEGLLYVDRMGKDVKLQTTDIFNND